ncbi:MAG: type II secretion system major pseudopilin GspG [Lentisphaeraceae bacterium]|nr:type II secretion system major pseudopilin GspG [Lentisphaeraceae bacterium]
MKNKRLKKRQFSLLEVIIAITIVALVATIAVQSLTDNVDEANVNATKIQMESFKSAVGKYKLATGKFPNSLEDLVTNPGDAKNWRQILEEIPQDPWGNDYMYNLAPETFNKFEIVSYGADGQAGGEGFNADITLSKTKD